MLRLTLAHLLLLLTVALNSPVLAKTNHQITASDFTKQKIVVASSNNFPPLNILNEDNELEGFGRDISDAVFRELGIQTERIHSSKWTEVLKWLDSGRADVIHDTGYTPDRESYLDFTQPIITMDEVIFVRNEQLDIHDLKSLAGKKVACVNKHITHIYLQKFDWINCHTVATPIEGVHALLSGRVDAYIYPREIILYHLQNLGVRGKVKITGDVLRQLDWSMTVKRGNTELVQLLNQGIKKIKENAEYDRIYNKWFGKSLLVGYSKYEVWLISLSAIGVVIVLFLVIGLIFHTQRLNKEKQKLESTLNKLKFTQTALKASEQHLRGILNNSPAVIYVKDTEGRFLFINHKFETLFNLSNEEIQGKTTHELFPKEVADAHRENDLKVLESCESIEYEEYTPINDEIHTYLSSKFCLFDEKGEAYAVCGISTDISERKNAEQALAQYRNNLERTIAERTDDLNNTNELLHAVLDTIPIRVFWKNRQNHYLGCNKAFLHDAGLEKEEDILDKSDNDLVWADQAAEYQADDKSVMQSGESRLGYEEQQTTPDGTTIWLETSKIPLKHADGSIYGVMGTYQDVTERKEFESKLIQSKKEAEAANQAKSTFLANMSHELRTPLHGILSFAELGREKIGKLTEEKLKEYFSHISVSGKRLKVLLDDLLDLSKLEAGKVVLEYSLNNIPEIIESCVNEQTALINRRQLSIKYEIAANLPDVECDKNRIGQVVMNILSNAIKFSPDDGQIIISAQLGQINNENDSDYIDALDISIADQGGGIPEGEEDVIFKKFIQSSSVKYSSGGTGLGLAITQELIFAHHGRIWCENLSRGGAIFHFLLPLKSTGK